MSSAPELLDRPRILVVGGGYVGLYVAMKLQKKVRARGGIVTVVDPLPYMTYQPFLPEVSAGSIEPRHAIVSHRMHLKHSELVSGRVTSIDNAKKVATVAPVGGGESFEIPYDDVVLAAGAITRTFPIPGLNEAGIGLKTIEEAVAIRDKVLERIETASLMPQGEERTQALTFVVVGGGFAGIEAISEMEDMIRRAVKLNERVDQSEIRIVLVEAMGRIMPEVTQSQAEWVVEHLRSRGVEVLLNTSLANAEDRNIELISMPDKAPAGSFKADTLLWTAGVQANPVNRATDFPVDERGRVKVNASLEIADGDTVIEHAWAAGDVAAVPDLSGGGLPDGTCVPNAQHAVRQAKRLAKNLYAKSYGVGSMKQYKHKSLGAVAGFGLYKGVANIMGLPLKGFLAWLAHRGYHGLAMPTFERKFRVIAIWFWNLVLGRDTTPLYDLQTPSRAFYVAATPKRPAVSLPFVAESSMLDAAANRAANDRVDQAAEATPGQDSKTADAAKEPQAAK